MWVPVASLKRFRDHWIRDLLDYVLMITFIIGAAGVTIPNISAKLSAVLVHIRSLATTLNHP
jgi:hypothetical protein